MTVSWFQNLFDARRKIAAWRIEYNEERPHEALGQKPPGKMYVRSLRAFPDRIDAPEYPRWFEVVTPWKQGRFYFRGSKYFVSSALRSERVGLVEIEEACFEVYFGKMLLGRIHTAHPELGLVAA